MHLYDGVHEPFWDLKILQNVKHVDFLIHGLRVADVPHVNYEILIMERRRQLCHASTHHLRFVFVFFEHSDSKGEYRMCHILQCG